MTSADHEQPQHGGSYRREKDGKLTRIDESAAAASVPAGAPAEAAADQKPARTKKEK